MPRPIPTPVRQAIWQRYQDGQDGPTIAQALDVAPRTIRHLLDRFRRSDPAVLFPSYDRCGTATPKPADALVQAALDLRRQHPTWGAGLIRVMLSHQLPEGTVPATRTLQRCKRPVLPGGGAGRPAAERVAAATPLTPG